MQWGCKARWLGSRATSKGRRYLNPYERVERASHRSQQRLISSSCRSEALPTLGRLKHKMRRDQRVAKSSYARQGVSGLATIVTKILFDVGPKGVAGQALQAKYDAEQGVSSQARCRTRFSWCQLTKLHATGQRKANAGNDSQRHAASAHLAERHLCNVACVYVRLAGRPALGGVEEPARGEVLKN